MHMQRMLSSLSFKAYQMVSNAFILNINTVQTICTLSVPTNHVYDYRSPATQTTMGLDSFYSTYT